MIISFFGHSNFQKTKEYEEKILAILHDKVNSAAVDFYLGGYGAFDDFAYECCKKYKETHPYVTLTFVTPYITLDYQKNHLQNEKSKYDDIIYPDIEDKPLRFAITYRNKWIVEQSDYIICAIDHSWGGAFKTYQYALQKGKTVFNIIEKQI